MCIGTPVISRSGKCGLTFGRMVPHSAKARVGSLAIDPAESPSGKLAIPPVASAPAFPLSQLFSPFISLNPFDLSPSHPPAPLTPPATMKPELPSGPAGNQPKPVRSFLWKTANPFPLQRIFSKIRYDRTGQPYGHPQRPHRIRRRRTPAGLRRHRQQVLRRPSRRPQGNQTIPRL
jgi:hypothetical protein